MCFCREEWPAFIFYCGEYWLCRNHKNNKDVCPYYIFNPELSHFIVGVLHKKPYSFRLHHDRPLDIQSCSSVFTFDHSMNERGYWVRYTTFSVSTYCVFFFSFGIFLCNKETPVVWFVIFTSVCTTRGIYIKIVSNILWITEIYTSNETNFYKVWIFHNVSEICLSFCNLPRWREVYRSIFFSKCSIEIQAIILLGEKSGIVGW